MRRVEVCSYVMMGLMCTRMILARCRVRIIELSSRVEGPLTRGPRRLCACLQRRK